MDVNGLKATNGQFGHLEGNGVNEQGLAAALEQANEQLESGPARYPRSISYGVVRGDCTEYPSLIAEADDQMYQYKLKHYERMARS